MPPTYVGTVTPRLSGSAPQQSFVQRLIEITITLDQTSQSGQATTFAVGQDVSTSQPGQDANTITLSGFRTSVRIERNGAPGGSHASVDIYGLSQSLMNQLTTLGPTFNLIQKNTILISAGDVNSGMTPVFSGTIQNAYGDYNSQPNVAFKIEAQSGLYESVVPVAVSSFPGPTDVATIFAGFSKIINGGVGFLNAGINLKLNSPYLPGNTWQKMRRLAEQVNINADLVQSDTILAIWPIGGTWSQSNTPIPEISPESGMIGYPTFATDALIVKMLFNPQVTFGGQINVKSSLPQANKKWAVQKLDLALDSQIPHGHWMGTAYCYPVGFLAPLSAGAPA